MKSNSNKHIRPAISAPPVRSGEFWRKCACGNNLGHAGECDECHLRKRLGSNSPLLHSDPQIGRNIIPLECEILDAPARPLDLSTRQFMESRFGYDFSEVRVHTDQQAAASARAVAAPSPRPLREGGNREQSTAASLR